MSRWGGQRGLQVSAGQVPGTEEKSRMLLVLGVRFQNNAIMGKMLSPGRGIFGKAGDGDGFLEEKKRAGPYSSGSRSMPNLPDFIQPGRGVWRQ